MPAAGTKKVAVKGEERYVDADLAELEAILCEGLLRQKLFQESKEDLDASKARLLAYAERYRNGRSSLSFQSLGRDGGATVKWASEKKLDPIAVEVLKDKLPAHVFALAFEESTVFKLGKGFKPLMQSKQAPEVEKHKAAIAACIDVKPKAPSVKFLAGEDSDAEGDEE